MKSETEALINKARKKAETHSVGCQDLPDYHAVAESFRRQTLLDSAGLGPELSKFHRSLGLAPQGAPVAPGRFKSFLQKLTYPLLARVLRATAPRTEYQAIYDMALLQQDLLLQSEKRLAAEIKRLRARLKALESIIRDLRLRD